MYPGNSLLQGLIEQVHTSSTEGGIEAACKAFKKAYGYDYYLMGLRFPVSLVRPSDVIYSDYPDDWSAWYQANGYIQVDPTLKHCLTSMTPYFWKYMHDQLDESQGEYKDFISGSFDFGLLSGISLPIRGPGGAAGLFCLVSHDSWEKSKDRVLASAPCAQMFANHACESLCRAVDGGADIMGYDPLSYREKECLLWASEGKTNWDIARILTISDATVSFHFGNVVRKLKATNRQHAVARGLLLGIITP